MIDVYVNFVESFVCEFYRIYAYFVVLLWKLTSVSSQRSLTYCSIIHDILKQNYLCSLIFMIQSNFQWPDYWDIQKLQLCTCFSSGWGGWITPDNQTQIFRNVDNKAPHLSLSWIVSSYVYILIHFNIILQSPSRSSSRLLPGSFSTKYFVLVVKKQ
jgi:hypothetical protein